MQAFSHDSSLVAVSLSLPDRQRSLYVLRLSDGVFQTLPLACLAHPPGFGGHVQLCWGGNLERPVLAWVRDRYSKSEVELHGHVSLDDVGCDALFLSTWHPKERAPAWSPRCTPRSAPAPVCVLVSVGSLLRVPAIPARLLFCSSHAMRH